MPTSRGEAAAGAQEAERTDGALEEALTEAQAIAEGFSGERADDALRPAVSVDLEAGGDDQPLFVFSVSIDIADDLAVGDYPLDEIQRLKSALRARVAGSAVDGWAWLVTVGTKATAAHG